MIRQTQLGKPVPEIPPNIIIYIITFDPLNRFLIIADRLAASFLEAKYKVVCTRRRAKMAVFFIWGFCLFGISPCVSWLFFSDGMHNLNENGMTDILIVYTQTALAFTFLFFSAVSYLGINFFFGRHNQMMKKILLVSELFN